VLLAGDHRRLFFSIAKVLFLILNTFVILLLSLLLAGKSSLMLLLRASTTWSIESKALSVIRSVDALPFRPMAEQHPFSDFIIDNLVARY
jgi:hypothetical protein